MLIRLCAYYNSTMKNITAKQIFASLGIILAVAAITFISVQFYRSLREYQVQTLLFRAQEAEQQGNNQEALTLRETIEKDDPQNISNLLAIATLHFMLDDYNQAQIKAGQVLSYDENADAFLLLGKVYLQTGDIQQARETLSSAVNISQDNDDANFLLALIQFADDKDQEAEDLLRKAASVQNVSREITEFSTAWEAIKVEQNPYYRDSLLAFQFLNFNYPYLALHVLPAVTENEPNYRDGHYLLAASYFETNQYEKAQESIQKALEIDPEHQPSKDLRAIIEKAQQ